jgi:ATP-dependent Lon protease
MASSSSIAVRELPLFPLPEVVLFPGRPLPLQIFEFRYRIMMNTILESDRRFGVLMWDQSQGKSALIGCCAEVIHYQRLPDDRMKNFDFGTAAISRPRVCSGKALSGWFGGVD